MCLFVSNLHNQETKYLKNLHPSRDMRVSHFNKQTIVYYFSFHTHLTIILSSMIAEIEYKISNFPLDRFVGGGVFTLACADYQMASAIVNQSKSIKTQYHPITARKPSNSYKTYDFLFFFFHFYNQNIVSNFFLKTVNGRKQHFSFILPLKGKYYFADN